MRIACVGGGPAGLYFALLMKLREPGHDITVFERNAAGFAQGFGVTFGPDLLEKLQASDPESAQEIRQAAFCQLDQVVDIHGGQVRRDWGGTYGISRKRLLAILAGRAESLGVSVEFGHEIKSAAQLPDADLIVASDGVNSRVRAEASAFQTDVHVAANKYLWLGTDKVFESFTCPFVRTDGGWVWAYAYGMGDGMSTFIVESTAQAWAGLGLDGLSLSDCLPVLEKVFERHLDGHRLLGQAQRGGGAGWLSFRTVTSRRWHVGNVVLVGDAAHTTNFTIGSGTTLAIEDAIALADCLQRQAGDQGLALESYERQRQAALLVPQSEARSAARWLENISRYADLRPQVFAALLDARRSPLLPYVPRHLYYRLHQAAQKGGVVSDLRRLAGAQAKVLNGRRNRATAARSASTPGQGIERDSTSVRLSEWNLE
jgi:2-polyprenyl-6-methoxyphenol hydroxylase-like FAD-dependent oxidoreductase